MICRVNDVDFTLFKIINLNKNYILQRSFNEVFLLKHSWSFKKKKKTVYILSMVTKKNSNFYNYSIIHTQLSVCTLSSLVARVTKV